METTKPVMNRETGRRFEDILLYQQDVANEDKECAKILYGLAERLDGIANRINGTDYPKNFPKSPNEITDEKLTPKPIKPNGFVGLLIELNEADSIRIGEMKNKIIPSLSEAIAYIETHI